MSENTKTFLLRLPQSSKKAVERLSKEDGISINQFIAIAVAEKIAMLDTARFFEEHGKRADLKAFDKFMNRKGGEPPRKGDELPKTYRRKKRV